MRNLIKISLLFCLLIMSSCRHKEFCIHHPHDSLVRVVFDWREAPEADPDGMCVFFYPVEGGEPRRYDFNNLQGGEITITVGRYNVLCYNNDTEGLLFKGRDNFTTHYAYTREGDIFEPIFGNGYNSMRSNSLTGEEVVITPDMMWGCIASEVEITDDGVCYLCHKTKNPHDVTPVIDDEHVITLYPAELTCIYTYEIINVNNLKHVMQACATISGMAGGMNLCDQVLDSKCVTLPLESYIDRESSTISGRFITFGHNEDNEDPHKMNLFVWLDDGQKLLYGTDSDRFNVTEQVHSAPNKRRVHLVIDGLDLPQPIENGHGFKPSVDDWDVVEEDIIM